MQASVASVKVEIESQMTDRLGALEAKIDRCEVLLKASDDARNEDKEIMVSPSGRCRRHHRRRHRRHQCPRTGVLA